MKRLGRRFLHVTVHPDGQHQLFPRAQLPVDVGESCFENIADWLPRAAVELN
jgi:hypothetical protein